MGILDTFKKRKMQADRGNAPVMYQQDMMPSGFRIQVMWIWKQSAGEPPYSGHIIDEFWRKLHDDIAEEAQMRYLGDPSEPYVVQCQQYLGTAPVDDALTIIERSFQLIQRIHVSLASERMPISLFGLTMSYEAAIDALNQRFAENNLGYQYVHDQIVCVDSQYIHSEVTAPAMELLHEEGFEGAGSEFMEAHQHYRHNRYWEALTAAGKSFESTLRTVCIKKNWESKQQHPNAGQLITLVIEKGLIPAYLDSHLAGIRTALASGLPTIRNKEGIAHGQGQQVIPVPRYIASHGLHLAAANIILVVEAYKSNK